MSVADGPLPTGHCRRPKLLLKDEDFTRIPFGRPFLDHLNDSYGALWQAMQIGTVCRPIFSGGRKGRLRASDSML